MLERPEAVDTAWRIHGALADWTGKAETKASFVLAIESAVLGGVVTLTGGRHRLAGLRGGAEVSFWVGVGFLVVGLLCVAWTVFPRLRGSKMKQEYRANFIYFGHLRQWKGNEAELRAKIESTDILPILTHQLVSMSDIAWEKHVWLQRSILLAVIGSGILGVTAGLR